MPGVETLGFRDLENYQVMNEGEEASRFEAQVGADAQLARLCDMAAAWLITMRLWHTVGLRPHQPNQSIEQMTNRLTIHNADSPTTMKQPCIVYYQHYQHKEPPAAVSDSIDSLANSLQQKIAMACILLT